MSTVLRLNGQGKAPTVHQPILPADDQLDTRIAVIQALIPLGLQAVEEVLQQEVAALAGPRYARGDGAPHLVRWGRQRGSVYLADQKLPVQVPRVRNRQAGVEMPLRSYTRLQAPRAADEGMRRRLLCGLSCRDYRAAAEAVPEAFGLSRSSVSRRYIRATARKLQALQERRLEPYDLVTLVLDGKAFADDVMVIWDHPARREGAPGLRADRHRECHRLRRIPAGPHRPRAADPRGPAGGARRQ